MTRLIPLWPDCPGFPDAISVLNGESGVSPRDRDGIRGSELTLRVRIGPGLSRRSVPIRSVPLFPKSKKSRKESNGCVLLPEERLASTTVAEVRVG